MKKKKENPSKEEHTSEEWGERFDKEFLKRPYEEGIIYASGDEVKAFIKKEKEKSKLEALDMAIGEELSLYIQNIMRKYGCTEGTAKIFQERNRGHNKKREEIINLKNELKE